MMRAIDGVRLFMIAGAGIVIAFGAVPTEVAGEEASLLQGTVLSPDGRPLAGVDVALGSPENQVTLIAWQNAPRLQPESRVTRTDEEGRFAVPADPDGVALAFVHEKGYAKILVDDFPPPDEVRLERWAKVEGVVMTGSEPGHGQRVTLDGPRLGGSRLGLNFYIEARGDEQGRFNFDWVPPGSRTIHRTIQARDRIWRYDRRVRFEANPGESVQVEIGGNGRPVVGRVVADDPTREIDWTAGHHSLSSKLPGPPEGLANLMEYDRWLWSEEMRRARAEQQRLAVFIDTDGAFRVEDVPAGDYELTITLRERTGSGSASGQRIGELTQEITVPEMPEGSDERLDLGALTFSFDWNREIGSPAPDFEFADLDGETFQLSDFRGKYVLLDFWATWCGPCIAETPNLKATYETFGGERFEIVALSIDVSPDAPRRYAKENDLQWVQVHLGWETEVPGRFGVRGIPAFFLIDPEGNIAAHGMLGEQIKAEVAKALGGA